MNATEILNILEDEEYEYYGLRAMMQNPETREFPVANIGESVDNSYDWNDGESTGDELNGTSALEINQNNIEEQIEIIKHSYSFACKQVVLIGSDMREYGDDEEEIIMINPIVLAVWNR